MKKIILLSVFVFSMFSAFDSNAQVVSRTGHTYKGEQLTPSGSGLEWNFYLELFSFPSSNTYACTGVVVTQTISCSFVHTPYGGDYNDYYYVLEDLTGYATKEEVDAWKAAGLAEGN